MKNLLTLIFISISTLLFGQDSEMLGFINQYRMAHGKTIVSVKDKLTDISINCNNLNATNDTLIHTKISNTIVDGEIITKGDALPASVDAKINFGLFLKDIFKIEYVEPKTNVEVITYTKLYIIYMYNQSKAHKAILLGEYSNVGFNTIIKDIKKHNKPKPIVVSGKTYTHKNYLEYYEVKFYSAVDFN